MKTETQKIYKIEEFINSEGFEVQVWTNIADSNDFEYGLSTQIMTPMGLDRIIIKLKDAKNIADAFNKAPEKLKEVQKKFEEEAKKPKIITAAADAEPAQKLILS